MTNNDPLTVLARLVKKMDDAHDLHACFNIKRSDEFKEAVELLDYKLRDTSEDTMGMRGKWVFQREGEYSTVEEKNNK